MLMVRLGSDLGRLRSKWSADMCMLMKDALETVRLGMTTGKKVLPSVSLA